MDNRLIRLHQGYRLPGKILPSDISDIAWSITAVVRGRAGATTRASRNTRYVVISGVGTPSVALRAEDWAKILPLMEDGTFSPLLHPVESGFKVLDPLTRFSGSTLRQQDPLYQRVFLYLTNLFTGDNL